MLFQRYFRHQRTAFVSGGSPGLPSHLILLLSPRVSVHVEIARACSLPCTADGTGSARALPLFSTSACLSRSHRSSDRSLWLASDVSHVLGARELSSHHCTAARRLFELKLSRAERIFCLTRSADHSRL